MALAYGDGSSYGDGSDNMAMELKRSMATKLYIIDDIPTIIKHIRDNVAPRIYTER